MDFSSNIQADIDSGFSRAPLVERKVQLFGALYAEQYTGQTFLLYLTMTSHQNALSELIVSTECIVCRQGETRGSLGSILAESYTQLHWR